MSDQSDQPDFAMGVDVSENDGDVNWQDVLDDGKSFAFTRATMGTHRVDALFSQNWERMGEVGITRGAYHFFHADQDAATQARHFLDTVELTSHDMPAVLDVERTDGQDTQTIVRGTKQWLQAVKDATGRMPIIYTGHSFGIEHFHEGIWGDARPPLWIARYTNRPSTDVPAAWNEWTFWQFAAPDDGAPHIKVAGIGPFADVNRFNGSHEGLVLRFGLR